MKGKNYKIYAIYSIRYLLNVKIKTKIFDYFFLIFYKIVNTVFFGLGRDFMQKAE